MKIISAKSAEDGKTYYVERYEDDQYGFVLKAGDATRFHIREVDRALTRLCYEYPTKSHEFEVIEEPFHFRIVTRA
jgi:hypothetical protein